MNRRLCDCSAIVLSLTAITAVPACRGESASGPPGDQSVGASGTSSSAGTHGGSAGATAGKGGANNQGGRTDAAGGTGNGAGGTSNTMDGGADNGGAVDSASGGGSGEANSAGGSTSSSTGGTNSSGGSTSSGAGGTSSPLAGSGGTGGRASGGRGGMNGNGGTAVGTGGGTAGSSATSGGNRLLIPSATGWIDHQDVNDDVGIQGGFYPYGDQYGSGLHDKVCLTIGQHQPSECAFVSTPDPTAMAFPNVNGAMHTAGTVERVLPCVAGSMAATIPTSGCPGGGQAGGYDYANMLGAGIAFDFNRDTGPPDGDGMRRTWDPLAYEVIGISFTIQGTPHGMRVEFPMALTASEAAADAPPITGTSPTTEYHSAGSPYWGAKNDGKYPNSPVVEGPNTITWDQVQAPKAGVYAFDLARLLGIKFHVPTSTATATAYDFTISNLTFLRHL